eukprot:SAG31_NODE_23506_length_503_cov_0.626238_1_plen_112_part_10
MVFDSLERAEHLTPDSMLPRPTEIINLVLKRPAEGFGFGVGLDLAVNTAISRRYAIAGSTVVITAVEPSSVAEAAGVCLGDELVRLSTRTVDTSMAGQSEWVDIVLPTSEAA